MAYQAGRRLREKIVLQLATISQVLPFQNQIPRVYQNRPSVDEYRNLSPPKLAHTGRLARPLDSGYKRSYPWGFLQGLRPMWLRL